MILLFFCGCESSQQALLATTTQVASDLYNTQTAAAPTAVVIEQGDQSGAEDALPDSSPDDQMQTSLPPATPWPVEVLTNEDQAQLLCYQIAALTYVDWVIHSYILSTYWPEEISDREFTINKINEMYWYTTHWDLQFIIDKGEGAVISDKVTVYLNKSYYLNEEDLSHCGEQFVQDLAASRSKLGYHPWLPEGTGPIKRPPPEG